MIDAGVERLQQQGDPGGFRQRRCLTQDVDRLRPLLGNNDPFTTEAGGYHQRWRPQLT